MNPQAFVQKWKAASGLTERAASQQHFLDLCDLLGEKKPADVDPTGTSFTFEKGVTTTENRKGFADVWRRGCFGWEYTVLTTGLPRFRTDQRSSFSRVSNEF